MEMNHVDMLSKFVRVLEGIARKVVLEETKNCLRLYKATIIKAPYVNETLGAVCDVLLSGDSQTLTLPYSSKISNVSAGELVWVASFYGSFVNAIVWEKLYFN